MATIWTNGPTHTQHAAKVLTLEPAVDPSSGPVTTANSYGPSSGTIAVADLPQDGSGNVVLNGGNGLNAYGEIVIGTGTSSDPYETILIDSVDASFGHFTDLLNYTHAAGSTIQNLTSQGTASFTFIPVLYLNTAPDGGDQVTFLNTQLTVDPS
jgi:hypothetical protein